MDIKFVHLGTAILTKFTLNEARDQNMEKLKLGTQKLVFKTEGSKLYFFENRGTKIVF